MTRSPDLVLVDGSSYLYRAFHSAPEVARLTTSPLISTGRFIPPLRWRG